MAKDRLKNIACLSVAVWSVEKDNRHVCMICPGYPDPD